MVPTAAILLTLYITKRDRRINARNRKDDLAKYEAEKLEVLKEDKRRQRNYSKRMLGDLETYLSMTVLNARGHLATLDTMIEGSSFNKLKRFSITVMVNEHLQGLLRIDYNAVNKEWDGIEYLRYLNSIELIDKLYDEITSWNNRHKSDHSLYFRAFDNALHVLFYEIEKLRFDDNFNPNVFDKLNKFRDDYNDYVDNFKANESDISAKRVSELKEVFLTAEFMKLTGRYYYLHDVILNMEIAIISLERLAENSIGTLSTIRSGIETHIAILEKFGHKIFSKSTVEIS